MTGESIVCPSCGNEVPIGRFCKSCGESLESMISPLETTESEVEASISRTRTESFPPTLPDFGFIAEEFEPLEFAILMSRAELVVIRGELDSLIEQIQATRQALKLNEADKGILGDRADDLRRTFDSSKRRREELLRFKDELPLERILDIIREQNEKLSKREEMKESVDKSVYKEQIVQISDATKESKKKLKTDIKTAEKWAKSLQKIRQTLERTSSRLDA
ncbi:MAG: hypothetical protein ACFE7R_11845, partial [Candidatus Hodarchaeota archaeon]